MSWIFKKIASVRTFASFGLGILPSLTQNVVKPSWSAPSWGFVRCVQYGNEYRPNNLQRKRKHGFLARQRTKAGRRILKRRKDKQRKFLSHWTFYKVLLLSNICCVSVRVRARANVVVGGLNHTKKCVNILMVSLIWLNFAFSK